MRSGEYHVGTLHLGLASPDIKCDPLSPNVGMQCTYQFTWKPNSSGTYYLVSVKWGEGEVIVDATVLFNGAITGVSTRYVTQTSIQPYAISSSSVYTTQLFTLATANCC